MTGASLQNEVYAALRSHWRETSYNWQDSERGVALIAEGVMRGNSGVQAGIDQLGRSLGDNFTAVATLLDRDLGLIASGVAELSRNTTSIDDALRNPRSTSAAEAYRRGIYALQNDWPDDALEELALSVAEDRYFAPGHAYFGLVKVRLGRAAEALPDFRLAVKYGIRHFPSTAAGAALLGARTSMSLGDMQSGLEILDATQELHTECPELVVMTINLGGDTSSLEEALRAAPELAATLSPDAATRVEPIIEGTCEADDGPVAISRTAGNELGLLLGHVMNVRPTDERLGGIARESESARQRVDEARGPLKLLAAADLLHYYRECAELPLSLAEGEVHRSASQKNSLQAAADRVRTELARPDKSADPMAGVREKIQKAAALRELEEDLAAVNEPTWLLSSAQKIRTALQRPPRISPWSG
ncbi:hypothetical protein [Arthrobacter sp. 2MCAF14]|uniref:hypothetical protein n=1 Tax=Arthrobacter sp. 2MCAF14 TaxID=3232982 RepID=UPI003F932513